MNQKGISLVESLLAVTVISGVVFLIANIPNSISLINKSKHLGIAKEIASKKIEDVRTMDYSSLVNANNVDIADSRIAFLPSGSATMTLTDCNAQICINSEEAKIVYVVIRWKEGEKQQQFRMDTIISEGGF